MAPQGAMPELVKHAMNLGHKVGSLIQAFFTCHGNRVQCSQSESTFELDHSRASVWHFQVRRGKKTGEPPEIVSKQVKP
jgi:hypothetical protein